MVIQFTVPAVALLFETDFENDPQVTIGCDCNGGKGYSGPLSNVPLNAAYRLVEGRSNLLRLKQKQSSDQIG